MGKTRSKKMVTKGDGRCGVMDNEEIINGMQRIMEISMCYCHPSIPDVDDWHAAHSIAETIYNCLKEN